MTIARSLVLVLVLLLVVVAQSTGHADVEPLPPYFHGRSAIPTGARTARVVSRFITQSSLVFVSVDHTASPVATPATGYADLQVSKQGDGYFEVESLDGAAARTGGVAFNWAVFRPEKTGLRPGDGYAAARARMEKGLSQKTIAIPLSGKPTAVALTVFGAQPGIRTRAVPGLRVLARRPRELVVGTLDGRPAAQVISFN